MPGWNRRPFTDSEDRTLIEQRRLGAAKLGAFLGRSRFSIYKRWAVLDRYAGGSEAAGSDAEEPQRAPQPTTAIVTPTKIVTLNNPGKGKKKLPNYASHREPWSEKQLEYLHTYYGRLSLTYLAAALGRTKAAVQKRAQDEGVSFRDQHLTIPEIQRIFGVAHTTVEKWVNMGAIQAHRFQGLKWGQRNVNHKTLGMTLVAFDEVERFASSHPSLYDYRKVNRFAYPHLYELGKNAVLQQSPSANRVLIRRPWTAEDNQYLITHCLHKSFDELAIALRRSRVAVKEHLRELRLQGKPAPYMKKGPVPEKYRPRNDPTAFSGRHCHQCGVELVRHIYAGNSKRNETAYEYSQRKFCSVKCRATYRTQHALQVDRRCAYCNEPLVRKYRSTEGRPERVDQFNNRKYCDRVCQSEGQASRYYNEHIAKAEPAAA